MIDHDRLFKELLTTFLWEFIDLFFPNLTAYLEPDSLTFLDKELFTDVTSGEQYEADLVVKVQFRTQESFFLIHVENQANPQGDFSQRMFRYFARLYEKFDLSVYPIAIFSYNAPQRLEPNFHQVSFPDFEVLKFNYRVIQLNRLNWRDFLHQPNPVASALMSKMKMTPQERVQVKVECLRLMTTLRLDAARMQLISGFIDTYLRLSAEEEQQFQAQIRTIELNNQREEVMEIVTSWMEQGIKQGEVALILRQLNRRFGSIAPELETQIRSLAIAQLENLGEALLDFADASDLVAWLSGQTTA
ncbi:MAG: DUF4351 domain-containing protein [Chroococcus sp. CMT-3BRIN-NPC107]|jgi:predicted transposase YdaD|nr:DUF4351 domain-containing protein [Chroococcus sp. CMT-3BRIN-NPC107]